VKPTFSSEDQMIIKQLESLKSIEVEYPKKLLSRRRAAFIKQISKREKVKVGQALPLRNKEVFRLLEGLTTVKAEYPPEMLARRRLVFKRQVLRRRTLSWWEAFWSNIQGSLRSLSKESKMPVFEMMRTSFVLGSIILATYLGFLINGNREELAISFNPSPPPLEASSASPMTVGTATLELAGMICKPGYAPPLCLAKRGENNHALSYQGNGVARAAVAKDTIPGFDEVHQPSYVNDGLYGSGASWVSRTAYSWIKIDLGKPMSVNAITFSKDRLSLISGGDPGRFTVAVAIHDNVYANGNSNNDAEEYKQVYDSAESGFSGEVSGLETVQVTFEPVLARYVKLTVTNPGTAIDEVEVFFLNGAPPPDEIAGATKAPNSRPTRTSTATNTPSPTNTPTRTPTLTNTPTLTFTPTATDTPTPTNTPTPTSTLTPTATSTATFTSTPTSTNTSTPTNTPLPTFTPTPIPTSTPLPTFTPTPIPTSTPLPTLQSTSIPVP